jgi:hypothetical protein
VNKKNFLANLSRQNKLEVHANRAVRAQNARTVERLVKDKYKLDDHVLDAAQKLRENKDLNKKVMLLHAQTQQIQENRIKKQHAEIKEKTKFDAEERHLDMVAKKRDSDIADHHRRIAQRDAEIFNIYNRPEQITQLKLEMHKNQHVRDLTEAMEKKEDLRKMKWFKDKKDRSDSLLQDMVTKNEILKIY